jgi:DNA-binding response OmpR family regulator
MKIAIVEDSRTSRKAMVYWFEHLCHQVFSFSCGEDFLKWLPFNLDTKLFVVDWFLPGINESDLIKAIRKISINPIMVLSVSVDNEKEEMKKEVEGISNVTFVSKPFHPGAMRVFLGDLEAKK